MRLLFTVQQCRYITIKDSMKIMRMKPYSQAKGELVFDVPNDADGLKKIYLKLAKEYHPDNKSSGLGSKKNFQELQEAY